MCQATSRVPLASEKPDLEGVFASLELEPIEPQEVLAGQAAVHFVSIISFSMSACHCSLRRSKARGNAAEKKAAKGKGRGRGRTALRYKWYNIYA